jgi:hypothetical protein
MWFLIPVAVAIIAPIATAITCDAISASHQRKRDKLTRRYGSAARDELEGLRDLQDRLAKHRADKLHNFDASHLSPRNRDRFEALRRDFGLDPNDPPSRGRPADPCAPRRRR